MSSPILLSICIPTYNRARNLNLLLHSLADQVHAARLEEQVEIVVSDNASTDGTSKVAEKWAFRHSFIRYFRNASNIGGEPNFIRAIERGAGKYAWVFGDDDHLRQRALVRVLSYLKPGVTQLYLNYRCVSVARECLTQSRISSSIPADIRTIDLVRQIGFLSGYALISSHIFDREMLLATRPMTLLRISPYYVLSSALMIAFHNQMCRVVHEPLIDYTIGNERLPDESALYVRVLGVLHTLRWLESAGIIDADFLYGCYETGAGAHLPSIFLREELYGSLMEMTGYWALPGRVDQRLIGDFVERGPGFWGHRRELKNFFHGDFELYSKMQRPIIHHWHGKAGVPALSILLASDLLKECEAFDHELADWPAAFAHESLLVSRLPEDQVPVSRIDVHLSPYREHRSPCAALNTGLRKALGADILILDHTGSDSVAGMIAQIETWRMSGEAPAACLIFASAAGGRKGLPHELLGLYVRRSDLVHGGGFENGFESWSRRRLIADAALRLGAKAWAVQGGKIPTQNLNTWFADQLPPWVRLMRKLNKKPVSEHGLNITLRGHLTRLEANARP
jgi:glycosyltransferase involved in cell wall biosynthesis